MADSVEPAALGHLGHTYEAHKVWAEMKEVSPGYSFKEHVARLPFADPADAEKIKDGFAKTGLTE